MKVAEADAAQTSRSIAPALSERALVPFGQSGATRAPVTWAQLFKSCYQGFLSVRDRFSASRKATEASAEAEIRIEALG